MATPGESSDVILANIKKHVPSWLEATLAQLDIRRMNGLSNACYRVTFRDYAGEDRVLLYRKFESKVSNKEIEAIIFKYMSDQSLGPKLIFQNSNYRLEQFFNGRPLTIWEMRNPALMKFFARAIFKFHHESGAVALV